MGFSEMENSFLSKVVPDSGFRNWGSVSSLLAPGLLPLLLRAGVCGLEDPLLPLSLLALPREPPLSPFVVPGMRSSRALGLYLGAKTRELSDAGGALDGFNRGQSPFSGLSRLARYVASVLALVVLYRRMGARPAMRFRQVKQVEVVQ